ncbi:MAG: hypothetical protein IKT43_01910 [Clostridia bacterium]|nr:hypothetical protein [Clostridia bacterium]
MKITGKCFTITVTDAEINTIVAALEEYTAEQRNEWKADALPYEKFAAIRECRNAFAAIIGKYYIGADA